MDAQSYEQFNIVQSPQMGFVDGRRACVRGGCAGHLPRRQDGVVRRDGVGHQAHWLCDLARGLRYWQDALVKFGCVWYNIRQTNEKEKLR